VSQPSLDKPTQHFMTKKNEKALIVKDTDEFFNENIGGEKQEFLWLMEHLLPYSEKIRGCELLFPDTVFYSHGKPKIFIKSDKDHCLVSTKSASKLAIGSLQKELTLIYRSRIKDNVNLFTLKYPELSKPKDSESAQNSKRTRNDSCHILKRGVSKDIAAS
jgi:hypothetical protein